MLTRRMESHVRPTPASSLAPAPQAFPAGAPLPAGAVRTTRLDAALDWAASLAPSPLRLATSCCGMAMVQGGDFFELLGSGPPVASGRAADLLIVAGSITRRQLPSLLELHARMVEPRWVMAWGACAISGGPYQNHATISGLSRILPVDVVVPGCPPAPPALRDALEALREAGGRRRRLASSGAAGEPIEGAVHAPGSAGGDAGQSVHGFGRSGHRSEGG